MRRLHLFEWEDMPWLPRVFRDFITDHLRYSLNEPARRPLNLAIAQHLEALIRQAEATRIVDLCAGAGGPLITVGGILADELNCPVDILLTDLYPNAAAFRRIENESGGRIRGRLESTSAFDVPADLTGVRTVFTALHHFPPERARLILLDAARKRAPIAVFEPLERSVRFLLLLSVGSLVRGLTHTPWVGKLTPLRFVLTYLIPIAPLIFAWDGMVSVLRSYTEQELLALGQSASAQGYRWEGGRLEMKTPVGPIPTFYLIGRPD